MQPVQQNVLGPLQPLFFGLLSRALDLTTVTGIRLEVERADGSQVNWLTATLVAAPPNLLVTATQAFLQYVVQAGDLTTGGSLWLGIWRVAPFLSVGANYVEVPPQEFRLVNDFYQR